MAVYARVSKDTLRLRNSISMQISYYSRLIQNEPNWEYAGIYGDFGITGTSTVKRSEFGRMLADCEAGKIDIILTKSISRFARNTVDLLETVRHLKSLGIEVWFEKEQIHSLSEEGELMLSLLASFAQEESRSISENVKWGIRKRFQSGEIGVANKHILGYRYDEGQEKYVVIPEEAKTIRQIFKLYLEGYSLREIARTLNESGLLTAAGYPFREASLNGIIHNEAYVGDIRRQKYFIEDPITKKKVQNKGELMQYYIAECHEGILDRETWLKVQEEMERRASAARCVYCFTGKIRCGLCGQKFTRKKNGKEGSVYVYWICQSKKKAGAKCPSRNFREDTLKAAAAQVLEQDLFDEEEFEKMVRKITVMKDGNLEFNLYSGRKKIWQKT